MTIWAIFSDVHNRGDRLRRVLSDAQARGADQYLFLGDLGSTHALDKLSAVGAECVFGNWEASGLRGMSQPWRSQVAYWPALYRSESFWASHASPVWPEGLTIAGVVDYLRTYGLHWTALFPSLHHSPEARWAALAELEAAGLSLFFHGHTHVQETWIWRPDAALARLPEPDFAIPADSSRLLIGVGSVGDPHDGSGACYALYDETAYRVTLRRV
jgi:predicted phosphodiesterase